MTRSTAYDAALGLPNLPAVVEMSLGKSADHMMQVIAFHELYGVPRMGLGSQDAQFRHMDNARVGLRLGLIVEEFKELLADGFGIETHLTFVTSDCRGREAPFNEFAMKTGKVLDNRDRDTKEPFDCRKGDQVADALGDLVYVIYGFALEMGYDLRAVIKEIHASNMTKLGEDGRPILRADGKVLKGPNYVQPNIPAALEWEE